MTQTSRRRRFRAKDTWPRRASPCLVPDSIFQTPLKAFHVEKIYQKQRSFDAVATMHTSLAHGVANHVFGTGPVPGYYMTWAIWFTVGRAMLNSLTRSTSAPSAASTSTRIPPNTLCSNPATPIASSPWRCDSSSRTACRIKPPAGICGAITASSYPSPRSKTGWRPGGKKAARQMWTTYLDWGLADFSGSIAADELTAKRGRPATPEPKRAACKQARFVCNGAIQQSCATGPSTRAVHRGQFAGPPLLARNTPTPRPFILSLCARCSVTSPTLPAAITSCPSPCTITR